MKNSILLLVFFLFYLNSSAQSFFDCVFKSKPDSLRTHTYEVIYDFKTGLYQRNNVKLLVDVPVIYKIVNINRMAYDVTISSKDTILAETSITNDFLGENKTLFTPKGQAIVINTSDGVVRDPKKMDISTLDTVQDFIKGKADVLYKDLKSISKISQLESEKIALEKVLENLKLKKGIAEEEIDIIQKELKDDESKLKEFKSFIEIEYDEKNLEKVKSKTDKIKTNLLAAEKKLEEFSLLTAKKNKDANEQNSHNDLSSYLKNFADSLKIENQVESILKAITLDKKKIDSVNVLLESISKKKISINDISGTIDNKVLNKIKDSITNKSVKIQDLIQDFDVLVKKYASDQIALQEAFSKLNDSYQNILKLKQGYLEIKSMADDPYLTLSLYEQQYQKIAESKYEQLVLQKELILSFKKHFQEVEIKYSNLKYNPYLSEYLNYGGLTKLFAQADYMKELADRIHLEVSDLNLELIFDKMRHMISLLKSTSTYEYISAPLQPKQDAIVFDIKITKKENNQAHISEQKSFKHTEFTRGGTRIDFSIGLSASYFSHSNTYEFGFATDPTTNEPYTTLAQKNSSLTVPSLVGLVTMSRRRVQNAAYGVSAGLGIDVVNGKIQLSNFFMGPTILFGKYERIFVTLGPTFRNVGQLKSGYSVGDRVNQNTDSIENFLTDKYKIGWFAAITFNLTKGVKANYKKLK